MNNFHKLNSEFSANFWFVFANLIEKGDTRHYFLEFGAKSGKFFIENSQKKCKIRIFCDWISEYSLIQSQIFLAIFDEKIEIRERCKGVHCVDLGESFPTSIYLQKSASIKPRTIPSKFWGKFNSLFIFLVTPHSSFVEEWDIKRLNHYGYRTRRSMCSCE